MRLFHVLHNEDKPHSLYSGCDCMHAVDLEWTCLAARAKFSVLVEVQGLFSTMSKVQALSFISHVSPLIDVNYVLHCFTDAVVDSGITVDSDLSGLGSTISACSKYVHGCALLPTVKLSAWGLRRNLCG